MSDKPVALVDMDGTICNFHETLERDLRKTLGEDYEKISERTRRQLELTMRQRDGWYFDLEPLPLGFRIVELLREVGFEIMILTKGNPRALNAWSEKVAWIKKYLPDTDQITITTDKGLVYGKVLVDDWPSYIDRWLEHRPRGLVVMPGHRWNTDYSNKQTIRVTAVEEVEKLRPIFEEARKR